MKGVQDGMVQSPGAQGKRVHRFAWRADREALAVSAWLGQRTPDGRETAGQPVALGGRQRGTAAALARHTHSLFRPRVAEKFRRPDAGHPW